MLDKRWSGRLPVRPKSRRDRSEKFVALTEAGAPEVGPNRLHRPRKAVLPWVDRRQAKRRGSVLDQANILDLGREITQRPGLRQIDLASLLWLNRKVFRLHMDLRVREGLVASGGSPSRDGLS